MEYSPPPLFKQGPSALARLIFFVLVALALLISDARFKTLEIVRGVLGAGLYPLQRAALVPRDNIREHFVQAAADEVEIPGMFQVRAHGLEKPEGPIHVVVFGRFAGIRESVRQHPAVHAAGKGAQDIAGYFGTSRGQCQTG